MFPVPPDIWSNRMRPIAFTFSNRFKNDNKTLFGKERGFESLDWVGESLWDTQLGIQW